jgi:septum formation protein
MRQRKIVLASTSPRRKEILEKTGLKFKIIDSGYEEVMVQNSDPIRLVKKLALGKAKNAAKRYREEIIIAADTFVVLGQKKLGKPKSKAEAKRMLKQLSGKTHSIITGFVVIDTMHDKTIAKVSETKVYFRKIKDSEIDAYLKTDEPMDKAGAYAIQGLAAIFVKKIEGDYFNAVGLPLNDLVQVLDKLGLQVMK